MKAFEKHKVSFSCNKTLVHLIGERIGIHLSKSICFENPEHGKLEANLAEVGFHSPIRNTKELFNAINSAIGYWKKNNVLNEKMTKDVRYFGRRQKFIKREFDELVETFNHLTGRSYHFSDAIKIHKQSVNIKIPSRNNNKLSLTFTIANDGMYRVNLNITNGPLTKSFERKNRRLMNGNALVKQFQDWVHGSSFEGHGQVLLESKDDVRNFIFYNKPMLTDLIEDLNRYKDK